MAEFEQSQFWDTEEESPYNRRLAIEWTTLNAIREMLGIGFKGKISPTYEQAIAVGKVLAPQVFATQDSLLGRGNEPALVEKYRQQAEATSEIEGKQIEPLTILDADIETYRSLNQTSGDRHLIQRHLDNLVEIRPFFLPKRYTENQLIIRDVYTAIRELPTPPISGDKYRDYRLSADRGMRIRLIHPDPPEHSLGADLIYEHHWEKRKLVRIALIQYKIWNGKTLYLSQANNLARQMEKLHTSLCETGLCKADEDSARSRAYRLPFCAGFLRPTDKLQQPDSRLISSGWHIPVCVALRAIEDTGHGNKKIVAKRIRSECVTHKVFEEVFNSGMLGSRWLTYQEVGELYQRHKIFELGEKVVIHAQEFGLS